MTDPIRITPREVPPAERKREDDPCCAFCERRMARRWYGATMRNPDPEGGAYLVPLDPPPVVGMLYTDRDMRIDGRRVLAVRKRRGGGSYAEHEVWFGDFDGYGYHKEGVYFCRLTCAESFAIASHRAGMRIKRPT